MAGDNSTQTTFYDTGEPTKRCSKCGKSKPLSEFLMLRPRGRRSHRNCYCRPCAYAIGRERVAKDPEAERLRLCHWQRKKRCGATQEDYERMTAKQGGMCACCGQPEPRKRPDGQPYDLSLDHDHKTGKLRGLLCSKCNLMIGYSRDNPAYLRAGAEYLDRDQKDDKSQNPSVSD